MTTITTASDERGRDASWQERRLFWQARSGAPVRSRLTLSDGATRRWKAPGLEQLVDVLNEPKLAKALLLRRAFAHAFVELASLMLSGAATGMVRLSFDLGAISRNELLVHLLQAEMALRPETLAAHVAFDVMAKPGVRFSFEIERPLPWLKAVFLRRRLDQTLKRLHMEGLRSSSA